MKCDEENATNFVSFLRIASPMFDFNELFINVSFIWDFLISLGFSSYVDMLLGENG